MGKVGRLTKSKADPSVIETMTQNAAARRAAVGDPGSYYSMATALTQLHACVPLPAWRKVQQSNMAFCCLPSFAGCNVGGCQNCGLFLDPYDNTHLIFRVPKKGPEL